MGNVRLYGSTSGYTELAAPAVAPDGVLTLPAVAGTLATTADVDAIVPGKILQVVSANYASGTTSTSTTYADTGLTATITPTSATSKILVLVNLTSGKSAVVNLGANFQLQRAGTGISNFGVDVGNTGVADRNYVGSVSAAYLDSPSTVSATIYKVQFASSLAGQSVYANASNAMSTITLMEVSA